MQPGLAIRPMRYEFTAVFIEGSDGWIIGYIEELPGAHSQGKTIEEAEPALRESVELTLRANRRFTAEPFRGLPVVRRVAVTIRDTPLAARARGHA